MILVTGAGGKTGRAVVRSLAARGAPVRVLVRDRGRGADLIELGATGVAVGDLTEAASVESAMDGVEAVYHICPNVHPDERAIAETVLAAATVRGVRRFVYHSVLHPAVEAMPHHWRKMRAEEAVFRSGLDWTILQPAAYLQNLLAGWPEIVEHGELRVPYPAATRLGMVDLEDVAAAAAIVLTESGHRSAIYELAGPEALTQHDIAARIQVALGRPVRAVEVPIDDWTEAARSRGLSPQAVDDLTRMFRYYADHGFHGNPRVLEHLLGRPARGLDDFLRRQVDAFS